MCVCVFGPMVSIPYLCSEFFFVYEIRCFYDDDYDTGGHVDVDDDGGGSGSSFDHCRFIKLSITCCCCCGEDE